MKEPLHESMKSDNSDLTAMLAELRNKIAEMCAMPVAEPFKLFDYRGCYQKSDGTIMYPYPSGIMCETRPQEGQIHIEWAADGSPKFVHKYKNGVGDGWVDVTATYRLPAEVAFVPLNITIQGNACECGNPKNPIGQGHSYWCKLFKQEF